jgi:hypothetical protein
MRCGPLNLDSPSQLRSPLVDLQVGLSWVVGVVVSSVCPALPLVISERGRRAVVSRRWGGGRAGLGGTVRRVRVPRASRVEVPHLAVCAMRDPGRGVDQLGTDGRGPATDMSAAGQNSGGAGEVVADGGADQPGGVRGNRPESRCASGPFFNSAMICSMMAWSAVGGFRGEHRLGVVGEHGVVAVDRERFGLPGRDRLRVQPPHAAHDQPGGDVLVRRRPVNAVKDTSATSASETHWFSSSSKMALG